MTSSGPSPVSWRGLLRAAIVGPLVPEISGADRVVLQRAAHSGARPPALRAMIVLAATQARSATDIASELGTSQLAVLRAVHRYRNRGVQDVTNPLT